ncbi:MAG: phospholipid carrier-dependent glycosyltransferase [Chloroflexi bacterium]|nr:phospholipid carrier-dependent glycosyltransferase [Chloroflexota bacterium]
MKKLADVLPFLFVLWLFAVFGGFYGVQKPFTPTAAAAIANALLDLLAAAWLGLLGLGLGHRLLTLERSSLNMPDLSTGEILILGCGLGLGALGLVTLGLGLAGLFYQWLFIALSLLLTLALWPDFLALYRRLHRPADFPNRLTMIYLIAVGLFTLVAGLLPPIDWDGLFYHLTAPKIFIQAHRISPGIDVPHFNFPLLAEMLFAYGMLVRGDIAAKLIHTLYGVLLTGLVYLTARRHLSLPSAWPAVLILLSMPMIVTLAGWAYNDLTLAFYQLAALYAFMRGQGSRVGGQESEASSQKSVANSQKPVTSSQTPDLEFPTPDPPPPPPDSRWLILSGVFAGLAMGLKYTSFVGPLIIGLILIWWLVREKFTLHASRFTLHAFTSLFSFALPALLVALPWYLKNFFFTGNPFYPFLSGIFDGVFWGSFRAAWYAQAGTGIGFDVKTLALLPVLATLGVRDVNYFDGRTGPLFLAFLPLILIYGLFRYRTRAPERPAALDVLLFFALAQFLFWVFGVVWSRSLWQSRLLLPCLVALSPVVGWLWQDLAHLDRPQFSIRRFANLLIGLALALNLVDLSLSFVQVNPLAYLTGTETRAGYLTRRLGAYYAAVEQMNQTLPPTAVVQFLWEPRSYYCQVACRPDSILDQLAHDHYLYGSAAKIVEAWKKAGITHVLLHRQGLDFVKHEGTEVLSQPALDQLAVLEAQYFEPVFDLAGAYQVYVLK